MPEEVEQGYSLAIPDHLSKKQMVGTNASTHKSLKNEVARPGRLELPTLCLEGRRSIQLSYGRIVTNVQHNKLFMPF
jgi:hypothetical protein